jgi:predicted permease
MPQPFGVAELWRDARYGWRSLLRSPGFTLFAVLSLTLGVGINTAIFSVVDTVLLKSLPVQSPEQLVVITTTSPNSRRPDTFYSYPAYEMFRDKAEVFSGVIAYSRAAVSFTVGDQSDRVLTEVVSGNYFSVLGVPAFLGRTLTPADDTTPGAHPVAVLSYRFWQRRFGSDRSVVGKTILLNGNPFTVVGVTPAAFSSTSIGVAPDVRVPIMMRAQVERGPTDFDNRFSSWLEIMARRKPGVTLAQADAATGVLFKQMLQADVEGRAAKKPDLVQRILSQRTQLVAGGRGWSELRRQVSQPLLVVAVIAGLELLIACVNVANLLLARAGRRRRELAIRAAVGGSRVRLVRQLLVESLELALIAGVCGLVMAFWASPLFARWIFAGNPQALPSVAPDARLLAFALAVSVVTGLLFGIAPALRATRLALVPALAAAQTDALDNSIIRFNLRHALVVAQVALSITLLLGAGLFVRTLGNLRSVNLGFRSENVYMLRLNPSLAGYTSERIPPLYDRLLERVSASPGVVRAGLAGLPLLSGRVNRRTIFIDGYTPRPNENLQPNVNPVSAGYFETLDIPLALGRSFGPQDAAGAPRVAMINQAMARAFWPDQNPVGRRFGFGRKQMLEIEVVGVVKDSKLQNLRDSIPQVLYVPIAQEVPDDVTLYVRTAQDAPYVFAQLPDMVRSLDKALAIYDLRPLVDQIDNSMAQEKLVAALSTLFGVLALTLVAVGLYGITSQYVAQRTKEIGIRIALGAHRSTVVWLITGTVVLKVAIGVAVGLPLALLLGRFVSSMVFGLSTFDPISVTAAIVTLTFVAALAALVPAWMAARVDPVAALRCE